MSHDWQFAGLVVAGNWGRLRTNLEVIILTGDHFCAAWRRWNRQSGRSLHSQSEKLDVWGLMSTFRAHLRRKLKKVGLPHWKSHAWRLCGSDPSNTAQHSTTQHGTAQHSTARHGMARHSTARHGTARHGTARHGTARHNTAQYNTAWHGTAQHSTAPHLRLRGVATRRFARTGALGLQCHHTRVSVIY